MAKTPSLPSRVIVVGGGLAGLAAALRISEAGVPVDLFSLVPVKRSHSVCAQGGINACNEVARQQGYSEWEHMDETLLGGDFLNHQPPVYEMTHWAPKIIDLLDRMGVPFNRTKEGFRDLRLFGGSLYKRTHFTGASTGQQLLYGLDEQVRKQEAAGLVKKYEFWEFLRPVLDESGACKGIVAQDLRTMEMQAFRADAVVMATGGCGLVYGKSTMSVICTGAAATRCYKHGALLGNPEMIQVHPTAMPGEDKCRLMSESARGEGGRVWVPAVRNPEWKDGESVLKKWKPHPDNKRHPSQIPESERWYFLEEIYPDYKNLVPRDIATREIFFRVRDGFGIGGQPMVYLDITHCPPATKDKLFAILDIYHKFTGDDPRETPMKIFPAVHYSMGGLYTRYTPEERSPALGDPHGVPVIGLKAGDPLNGMTNVPGLYAFGEVAYGYHGANRLGANALLSCIFDGLFCGLSVANYAKGQGHVGGRSKDAPQKLFDDALASEKSREQELLSRQGGENAYKLHAELGLEMTMACTVVKTEERLLAARAKIAELKARYLKVSVGDKTTGHSNQAVAFARALGDMLEYADALVEASIARKESRGAHYREDFKERDDANWQKSTLAAFDHAQGRPALSYEQVPAPMVPPRPRKYGSD